MCLPKCHKLKWFVFQWISLSFVLYLLSSFIRIVFTIKLPPWFVSLEAKPDQIDVIVRSAEGLIIPTPLRRHKEVINLILKTFPKLCEGWLERTFREQEMSLLAKKEKLLRILSNCSQLKQVRGGLFAQNCGTHDLLQNSWNLKSLTSTILKRRVNFSAVSFLTIAWKILFWKVLTAYFEKIDKIPGLYTCESEIISGWKHFKWQL